jgi:hypothetical protein
MMQYRETPRESEMPRLLAQGQVDVSPLKVVAVDVEPFRRGRPKDSRPDAELILRWQEKAYRFAVECKAISTPKEIVDAVRTAKRTSKPPRCHPLVFAPYLPEPQLRLLEEQQVSGIDLCGDALILVPGEILVFRTGAPNKFRRTGVIKNVYRKNSSIVARTFLLKPRYDSITEVLDEIRARGGSVTQATVSKVCASLDQDLVIERTKGKAPRTRNLRLIQPQKLLELVAANYFPPLIKQRLTAKTALAPEQFRRRLREWGREAIEKAVLTGSSSAGEYAVMAREPLQSYYCSNLESLVHGFATELEETSRFPNVEFLETDEDFVYFDARDDLAASPVQTYLELMRGDKREQETAEQVRKAILQPLKTEG